MLASALDAALASTAVHLSISEHQLASAMNLRWLF
jgi:hypothetical protein